MSKEIALLTFDLDETIFTHFPCFEGTIPAGYWGNWLGVLTNANVWAFSKEVMGIYNQTRKERFEYPINDEHILDWYPLLQSIIETNGSFTMAAIGCGWGRWLSTGAFAARYEKKDFFLIGVEAEPQHFEWLQNHLEDNKINADNYRLIHAAASNYCGECWFYVGKSASWYGQSIVSDEQLKYGADIISKIKFFVKLHYLQKFNNERLQRVACVDLKEILGNNKLINYMMLDIQGEEESFLTAYPEILQKHVKMVNIGTHSHTIENNLREFFSERGWTCLFDIPMNSVVQFQIKSDMSEKSQEKMNSITFGDGVQIWINNNI